MKLRPRSLLERAPDRKTVAKDAVAGIPGAIGSVPDGMASAVLAGVNPIHGLYASFAGPIAGGSTASTQRMVITTTTAAALSAGSALSNVPAGDRTQALFLMTVLTGAIMIVAGLVGLGRYTRFVSISVMIGFLTGVAVNIICGQLGDLTGADVSGSKAIGKALDLILHPGLINLASLLVGLSALAILAVLGRTRLSPYSTVVALVIPTVATLGVSSIARVSDQGTIPSGVPSPVLPQLSLLSPSLVTGAFAIAVIVLVQGAGVAESAPNIDETPSQPNRDFVAAGIGNLASGFFQGQPVGGSVGQTALNVQAGARSRWAAILSGIWMILILVAFSGVVGHVAMPTLAAVLVFAAIRSLRVTDLGAIMRTGATSQVALVTTFLCTLLLPIAAAVGIGVAISLLLQVDREARDLAIVELEPTPEGDFVERPAPAQLRSDHVTLLGVYGSLYYAGARTLQADLPDPAGAHRPVVVLRLRGRIALGATAFVVLSDYARRLGQAEGRLYLSGVDPDLLEQLRRNRRVPVQGPVKVFVAEPTLRVSTAHALADAEAWLVGHEPPPPA